MPDSPRRNLLFLAHRLPYPLDKGERIRMYHMVRYLGQRSSLYLGALADEPPVREATARLGEFCREVAVVRLGALRWLRAGRSFLAGNAVTQGAFASPRLRQIVREWCRRIPFDGCLLSSSSMAQFLAVEALAGVPTVADLIDVDSEKWRQYAACHRGWKRWLYRAEGERLRRLERRLSGEVRAMTFASQAEVDLFRSFCSLGTALAIPSGVDLEHFRPAADSSDGSCVFVGSLDYWPNVQGVSWFCREVWPAVHARRPGSIFRIVGRKPCETIRRLGRLEGVDLVGPVHDVGPFLARAAVVVAPLLIARGIQTKVLEALAMGKAVVASPGALAGLALEPGRHALSANEPAEWIEQILSLLADEGRRERLGAEGRRYVEERHQWETCLAPLDRLLGEVCEGEQSPPDNQFDRAGSCSLSDLALPPTVGSA